jgi:hypothetical protein
MTKSRKDGPGTRPKAFRVAPLQVQLLVEWMAKHGPASVRDVASWRGLDVRNARKRLAQAEKQGLVRFKPGSMSEPDRWVLEPQEKEEPCSPTPSTN